MFEQLNATMILHMESLQEGLCKHPFQQATTTLALSLWTVTLQLYKAFLQSHMNTSSTAMHSAHLILLPSVFQPGRSPQVAHVLLARRPIPHDIEALIQMLMLTVGRGVRDHETFGWDRKSSHHESWFQAIFGRWCFAKSLGKWLRKYERLVRAC